MLSTIRFPVMETAAPPMRSLSVSPVSGPTLGNSTGEGRKALSLRRKIYPEPAASARQHSRGNTVQHIHKASSARCGTILVKLLVGWMATVCFAWTVWLILLSIKPNDTVNWVMKTQNFDNGTFWLMVDPTTVASCFSVAGLSLVAVAYAFVLVKLVRKPTQVRRVSHPWRIEAMAANWRQNQRRRSKLATFAAHTALLLVKHDGYAKKIAVSTTAVPCAFFVLTKPPVLVAFQRVWLKLVDLGVESAILYQLLEAGSPPVLVAAFTTILGMNALSCALMMYLPEQYTGLPEVLVDTL
jgi:hypothetical protein